jgi:LacI family transcriptional regulator
VCGHNNIKRGFMRITIKKIAELAGVSRGTVDRVLNSRPGVRPEVKERILEIIEKNNYSPNKAGRALALSKKPVTIAVIMPPKEISFFENVLKGINEAWDEVKDFGVKLQVHHVNNRNHDETVSVIDSLIESGVQGILMAIMDTPVIRESIQKCVDRNIPVITFNTDIPGSKRMCFVGQNLYKSGKISADLMCKMLGKNKNVIILTGSMNFQAHKDRVNGFIDMNKAMDNYLNITAVLETYDNYLDTYNELYSKLLNNDISGLYMATGHVGACLEVIRNLKLADRIRVVCNDIIEDVRNGMETGILDFTITQNPYLQGYKPVKLIYDYIFQGKKPDKEFYYTENNIYTRENLI